MTPHPNFELRDDDTVTIGTMPVDPDAQFNGKLQVNGDVTVAGQLKLNSKLSASAANLTTLEAGKTSLADLNVNGDGTVTNLNVRTDLIVAGTVRVQGTTVLAGLVTTTGNLNVSGNITVGGTLAVTGTSTLTGALTANGTSTFKVLRDGRHRGVPGRGTLPRPGYEWRRSVRRSEAVEEAQDSALVQLPLDESTRQDRLEL